MTKVPESLTALAEALSPLSHSLAAGLLIRPIAGPCYDQMDAPDIGALCAEMLETLGECVPAMRQAMAGLENCEPGDSEELVDELATAALEIVDTSRRIWERSLPPEAESLRPLLATLVEAPAARLLQWVLEIMHLAIDPWSIADDPDNLLVDFNFHVPDAPLREVLNQWSDKNPGVLPDGFRF